MSDRIIILCNHGADIIKSISKNKKIEKKIRKIPHFPYNEYRTEIFPIVKVKHKVKFLFFGAIRRYKNIELLIDIFKELSPAEAELTIAGQCNDTKLNDELIKMAMNCENIKLTLTYLSDEELMNEIDNCDICIIPLDLKSCLNSSTVITAFTRRKTVICPLIGTLMEYDDKSFFYSYVYKDTSDHKKQLKQKINQIFADIENNPDVLRQKGDIAFNHVLNENNDEINRKAYNSIVDELILQKGK